MIVIDGQSGSAKTTIAAELVHSFRIAGVHGVQIAHLDDFYFGWSGLAVGTAITEILLCGTSSVTVPPASIPQGSAGALAAVASRGSGRVALYPRWNWAKNRVGCLAVLDSAKPLIVEGAGALSARSWAACDLALWLEAKGGAQERKMRALARDGDLFRARWRAWAEQEAVHIARNNPRNLADQTIWT